MWHQFVAWVQEEVGQRLTSENLVIIDIEPSDEHQCRPRLVSVRPFDDIAQQYLQQRSREQ